MRGRLWLAIALIGLLTGCAGNALYRPYTLRHPATGTTVTCGHVIWWECLVVDYEAQGFRRAREAR